VNTLPAADTVAAAKKAGFLASEAPDVANAVDRIKDKDPTARILICGSLYLAGGILRDHG